MKVTEETLAGLDSLLKEHLEADIVALLAERTGRTSAEALAAYYGTSMPQRIARGKYGIQYLSADYLVEEVIKEL